MNNKEIQNKYILGLSSSDFGRYIALCAEDMKYIENTIKRKDLDRIIKTSAIQTRRFHSILNKENIISKVSSKEIKLNFNILNHLEVDIINIEDFNLPFDEDRYSMLWLGHIMKIATFMILEGKFSLKKIEVQNILNIESKYVTKILKKLKTIKYKGNYIFKDDEDDIKILKMNQVFGNIEKYNCIYRFLNKQGEVLYIGSTKRLKFRMKSHFSKVSHLPKDLYSNIHKIEYYSFKDNSANMYMYEVFYINKYTPTYNKKDKGERLTLELPDIKWEDFDFSYLLE